MSKQEIEESLGSDPAVSPESAPGVDVGSRRRRPPDPLLLERLAEVGFLATEFGLHQQAELIFQCFAQLKPGKASPHIALALMQAHRGRMPEAIAAVRDVIERHPDSELARAVLGTMLIHVKDPAGYELLEEVIARGTDHGAVSVATSYLDLQREQPAPIETPPAVAVEYFRHYNVRS
ncbi:MAG: HrpB1 family type III secretion system apparatus protein [Steroidobacter sp.]